MITWSRYRPRDNRPLQWRKARNRWTAEFRSRSFVPGIRGDPTMASAAEPTGDRQADRQMAVGRVFERAFGAVRTNPVVILGLALVIGAIPNLLMTYLFVRGGTMSPEALASG